MRSQALALESFDFPLISMGSIPASSKPTLSPVSMLHPIITDLHLITEESITEEQLISVEEQSGKSLKQIIDAEVTVERYMPLVKQIASKLMRNLRGCDFDDLVSDGTLGLLRAVEQFDPSRGVKFETYATPVIRGSILNGLRALDWVPERKRIKTRELQRAMDRLTALHGREGTQEELATELKITAKEVYELIADLGTAYLLSLDQPASSAADEERSFLDTIKDENVKDPSSEIEFKEQRELLRQSLQLLSDREQMIVKLYYFEGISFEEIAGKMSISKQRISQLHASVMKKLRVSLSG